MNRSPLEHRRGVTRRYLFEYMYLYFQVSVKLFLPMSDHNMIYLLPMLWKYLFEERIEILFLKLISLKVKFIFYLLS